MSGFIKIGGVTMSDDQAREILFNSEDVAYDSTDTEGASDTDSMDMSTSRQNREKINLQLITTENEAVDELDDEIDINSSIHDSFINMINNDEEIWADVGLNLI